MTTPTWIPLAGPYRPSENWMLVKVTADLQQAGRKFKLVQEMASTREHNFIGTTILVQEPAQPEKQSRSD